MKLSLQRGVYGDKKKNRYSNSHNDVAQCFLLTGCGNKESPQERFKRFCGADIPAKAAVDYDYFSQSLQGDFVQYTIFTLSEGATEFLESNSFANCRCSDNHEKNLPWTNNIATEQLPDWNKSHLFKKFEANLLDPKIQAMAFYFTETNKLIVFVYLY